MNTPLPRFRIPLQAALIVAAVWFVYAPVFRGSALWDDNSTFLKERQSSGWAGLGEIWRGTVGRDYYPLKATVQWIQWRMWREDTLGYHLTNAGLHALGALLLWRLLEKLGLRGAWCAGMLFAVHPLAVESVAWMSELKNVLSLPPLLLALGAYVDYDHRREAGRTTAWRSYLCSLLWFLAAMLCKSSVVMLPVILLLYCWWRRGRIGLAEVRASAAYFGISLILGAVTIGYQSHEIGGIAVKTGGLLARVALAGMAAAFYFLKCVFPVGLLPVYPRWTLDPLALMQLLPSLAIAAGFAWLWRRAARAHPAAPGRAPRDALFGLAFFFINLIPVLGFATMSYQRVSWVADEFAYLPLAGFAGLAAAGLSAWELPHRVPRWAGFSVIALVLAALACASRRYAVNFANEESLWTYTLRSNPNAWLAHGNLGPVLLKQGRVQEAIAHEEAALRLRPDYAEAQINLGNALMQAGRTAEAIAQYQAALRLQPNFADTHYNLANALAQAGRIPEAIAHFQTALRLQPDFAEAHSNLGNALLQTGQTAAAIAHYQAALRLQPELAEVRNNLGIALDRSGRYPEAIAQCEAALRLKPDYPEAQINLAFALIQTGRPAEAIAPCEAALRLQPGSIDAHQNLGAALQALGRAEEAQSQFEAAARLKSKTGAGP